jgi:hypothetical protein
MTVLTDVQNAAGAVRQKLRTAEDQFTALRGQLSSLEGQLNQTSRLGAAAVQQVKTLQTRIQQIQTALTQSQTNLTNLRTQLGGILKAVPDEPWDLVEQLGDNLPFLLLPVRIEARFMSPAGAPELWVRIYPDDAAVHSHEPGLTAAELNDGQTFWREMWAAGQLSDPQARQTRQQGAWTKLASAYGSPRAAWIAHQTKPASLNVATVAALVFPAVDAQSLKPDSWSRAPRSNVMPDRFVVMGYRGGRQIFRQSGAPIPNPLILGPDPLSLQSEYQQTNGQLKPGADFAWVSDFPEAVAKGMGLRIPLDSATASQGLDRLTVLGLRLSSNVPDNQALLEELIDNHHYSPNGMSLLAQGTPTNNTDGKSSGFSSAGPDPAASFAVELGPDAFVPAAAPAAKTDAQRLAEALGLAYAPFQHLAGASQMDGPEAERMNVALFPVTGAYYLEEMLNVDLETIAEVRSFFTEYVTGRGPVTPVRIGNQPYGVLLTSDFSAWKWVDGETSGQAGFYNGLVTLLQGFRQTWQNRSDSVSRLGATGDPYQDLLNTLGLNPASVEFYRRYGIGWETLWNFYAFQPGVFGGKKLVTSISQKAGALLQDLGISFPQPPRLFHLAFLHDQDPVLDPLVDDIVDGETEKLSESRPPKSAYKTSDPAHPGGFVAGNYLAWLASASYDDIRQENLQGPDGTPQPKPRPLLYRLLRSALLLAVYDAAMRLYVRFNLLPLAARTEIEIANVDPNRTLTRWELLDAPIASVLPQLSNTQQSVGDWLLHPPGQPRNEAQNIDELRTALAALAGLPTARLERIFCEHIDLLTYRLDAWETACFARRLELQRIPPGSPALDTARNQGIYVGAFGWLENLRPAPPLTKAGVSGIPTTLFNPATDGDIFDQQDNGGFIHAPSLNQAVAAAVLRSAYLTHFDPSQPQKMAVNLSSSRVRTALSFLEGVRNGLELGALLGSQFERGLHDGYNDPLLNQYIPLFRTRYPLVADKITPDAGNNPIDTKEARNVVDGFALAEAVLLAEPALAYPYDVPGLPANPNSPQALHIQTEVARLAASLDGVADLLLSEGVYQVSQGNFERAGASLKTLTEGGMPPDPEIVKTPQSGTAVHQRIALHLGASTPVFWPGAATERSQAEPALNRWLGERLLPPDKITFRASWPGSPSAEQNLAALKLQPLDLVLMIGDQLSSQATELERRLAYGIRRAQHQDDLDIHFEFMAQPGDPKAVNLFELLPLLRRLRNLVTTARPLSALDYTLPTEVNTDPAVNLNPQRYDLTDLNNRLHGALTHFQTALANLAAAVPLDANHNPVLPALHVEPVRAALTVLAGVGFSDAVPLSAFGDTPAVRESLAAQALDQLRAANQKLANATSALATAAQAALPAAARLRAFQQAAQEIFGPSFNVVPRFTMSNAPELVAAAAFRDKPTAQGLLRFHADNPLLVDEWLQGAARVRPVAANLEQVLVLSEALAASALALKPLQLPFLDGDPWVAVEYPPPSPQETFSPAREYVSLLQVLPGPFDPAAPQAGLLLDEWNEALPRQVETTGIAVHYNQPSSQPPQTLLLAVTPEISGKWTWSKLEGILNDTYERAKQRAVEPAQLDRTAFGQLLPGVISAVASRRFATISTDLLQKTSV